MLEISIRKKQEEVTHHGKSQSTFPRQLLFPHLNLRLLCRDRRHHGTAQITTGKNTQALRIALAGNPGGDSTKALVDSINAILQPADNYGGRMSFRYLAPFSLIIIIVFGILYLRHRAAGRYTVEKIDGSNTTA